MLFLFYTYVLPPPRLREPYVIFTAEQNFRLSFYFPQDTHVRIPGTALPLKRNIRGPIIPVLAGKYYK